jgi:hypothetical protein
LPSFSLDQQGGVLSLVVVAALGRPADPADLLDPVVGEVVVEALGRRQALDQGGVRVGRDVVEQQVDLAQFAVEDEHLGIAAAAPPAAPRRTAAAARLPNIADDVRIGHVPVPSLAPKRTSNRRVPRVPSSTG